MREPIGVRDRRRLGEAVRRYLPWLDSGLRLHSLVDCCAVYCAVENEMNNMDVIWGQFARQRLSDRAQAELRRGEGCKPLAAANAGGGSGEKHGTAPMTKHASR